MATDTTNNLTSLAQMSLSQGSSSMKLGTGAKDPEALKKAAQQFEGMFLSQMMQHMMSGVSANPVFGGGKGEEMFKSVLVDEWAKKATSAGGVGLAAAIQRQLMKTQEV
jgi:Rod binding domain-containing protein